MSASAETHDNVTVICPNLACRKTVAAPGSSRGEIVRCVYCKSPFRVPVAGSREGEDATARSAPHGG